MQRARAHLRAAASATQRYPVGSHSASVRDRSAAARAARKNWRARACTRPTHPQSVARACRGARRSAPKPREYGAGHVEYGAWYVEYGAGHGLGVRTGGAGSVCSWWTDVIIAVTAWR